MKIVNEKDFLSGIFFGGFGIATAIGASNYSFGSASAMGPGYFPFLAGAILFVIGLVVIASSLGQGATEGRLERWDFKKISIILVALLLFAGALEPFGLIVALPLLVGLSSLAHPEFTWRGTLGTILVLLPLVWVIFVYLLGVRIPLLPVLLR
jgi:Tripartite tricarboxylate transporter TctB family.